MGLNHLILFIQQLFECLIHAVTILSTGIQVVNRQNSLLSGSFQSSGKRQMERNRMSGSQCSDTEEREGRAEGSWQGAGFIKSRSFNPAVFQL